MTIHNKAKLRAAATMPSTSTHTDNETEVKVVENDQRLKNHQTPDMLIDPEDDTGGSTHTSVTASVEEECDDMQKDTNNVAQKDNDVNPEEGYKAAPVPSSAVAPAVEAPVTPVAMPAAEPVVAELGEDDDEDMDEDEDEDMDEDEVDAAMCDTPTLESDKPSLLMADDEWDIGGDAAKMDDSEDDEEDFEEDMPAADEDIDNGEADDEEEDEATASSTDDMPLMDVDGMDDESDDAVFAAYGNKLMVIRANRIIATMNKKTATVAGHEDVYLSDQFEQVVASEINKKGMRKGLQSMGFTFAKVNVAKSEVVNARVEKQVAIKTAAVRRVVASKEKAFQESLAIASVGLNRGRFNDVSNPLKAALIEELQAAGVRNGARLVHRAFASFGIDYAKTIASLANKLAEQGQEVRSALVASFDMTNEGAEDEEDMYGVPEGDMDDEALESDEEFADDFEDEIEEPSSVAASLTQAGTRTKSTAAILTAKSTGYSVTAADILSGRKPLNLG